MAPDPQPFPTWSQLARTLATFDPRTVIKGFSQMTNPSVRGMLESMGRTDEERVEALATMLRNSSGADMEEMANLFALAMARVAAERQSGHGASGRRNGHRGVGDFDLFDRRRHLSAAEWRAERRRAGRPGRVA